MPTVCVSLDAVSGDTAELLMAGLAAIGYHAFEEKETQLHAYIDAPLYDPGAIPELLADLGLPDVPYQAEELPEKNWNEAWEKSFSPVRIGNQILIRAAFHPADPGFPHEIIIHPKMSFGTGHHATTESMMRLMLQQDFTAATVLDFGSGTGILSILAARLGATRVLAIDEEEWAMENSRENILLNGFTEDRIIVKQDARFQFGWPDGRPGLFDFILANINRNILLRAMEEMTQALKPGGRLLISGFYEADRMVLDPELTGRGLRPMQALISDRWCAMIWEQPGS